MTHFLAQPWPEIVVGLVAPVGSNLGLVREALRDRLAAFRYEARVIHLSAHLADFDHGVTLRPTPERDRLHSHMDAGNKTREKAGRPDVLALCAASHIGRQRNPAKAEGRPEPLPGRAWIVSSLKRPEEVETLRRIYGDGFFLVGVSASLAQRRRYLQEKGMTESEAQDLIQRDEQEEAIPSGQRTRDTFELADLFLDRQHSLEEEVNRFLDLVFGHPFHTPRPDEYGMYLAYAASLRSGDLSRQVGAALFSRHGDLIAVGANDAPRCGGGLYWPGEADQRDHVRGHDSNERAREAMVRDVVEKLQRAEQLSERSDDEQVRRALKGSSMFDITEYGRAVHAEMEALLAAGRSGVSPVGGTLYATTFPCHGCAKHIVAAGLQRVVFVEPYPKSRALDLHDDSIVLGDTPSGEKVRFVAFTGVGPRRFLDLYSLTLSAGERLRRKQRGAEGQKLSWSPDGAQPRIPLSPLSYVERESRSALLLQELTENLRLEGEEPHAADSSSGGH